MGDFGNPHARQRARPAASWRVPWARLDRLHPDAVTSTERTTKVSSSTPNATAKPISAAGTTGRLPRAMKLGFSSRAQIAGWMASSSRQTST
jgi:hypothetical protein